MSFPSQAVKRPVFTSVIFLSLVFLGIVSLLRLPVELYQGVSSGIISIIIRARGGLAPREVEHMITRPVEEAVSTVGKLRAMYSNSREAESRVTLEFEPGTDMNFAALEVREKFSRVKPKLPPEIEKPVIANYSDTDTAVIVFAVISDTKTPEEIRAIVDSELKPLLERLNGVASVEVYGGRERKILVELDRDKMVAYSVSIEEVMDILGASNLNLLAGDYERGDYSFAIRTMGAFTKIDEIGDMGVKISRQGSIIPLKEIATIKDSYLEPEDYARLNLNQNVSVYVKKISVANTVEVAKETRKILDEYNEFKKDEIKTIMVADRAQSIRRAISDVRDSLLIGVFLVCSIIY
ncbi:MAG: efflux RND transporter permease subunit, partial [Candidatus Omnitrophica bacterium]|nr:efflux RND transporter permease subunit [Candidatus Omnitrophota bacterium]